MSIREKLVSLLAGKFTSAVAYDFEVNGSRVIVKRCGYPHNPAGTFYIAIVNGKNIMLPGGEQLWSEEYPDDVLAFAGSFHCMYGDKELGKTLSMAAGHVSSVLYGEE